MIIFVFVDTFDMKKASVHPLPDSQLLRELAAGNTTALESLMLRYEERIYQFVFRLLGDTMLAEEVTQDVFIKIWEMRSDLGDIDSIGAWMHTLGRNHALNALKEMAARHAREQRFADEAILEVDGEREFLHKESQQHMRRLVEQLPPKRRQIFRLKTEEGMTNEEIGRFLDISPHTVKNQLTKTYLTLRRLLTDQAFVFFLLHVAHGGAHQLINETLM